MPQTYQTKNKTYLIYDFDSGRDKGFADLKNTRELYLKNNNKPTIVISNTYEGEIHFKQPDTFLEQLHSVLREYDSNKIVLVMGDANLEKNYTTWYRGRKEKRVIGKCIYYPYTLLKRTIEHHNKNKIQKKYMSSKPKHFICMNAAAKPHRFHMVESLFSNGWNSQGYITYLNRYGALTKHMANENFQGQNLHLDFNGKEIEQGTNQELLPPQYREACFDIVTESIISDTSLFITEKTWKPILYKTPFIPLGSKGMCKHLEKFFGIKLYSDMINYSFDYINYPDRLHRIKEDNLRRLFKTDLKTLNNWINNSETQKNIIHNYNTLINLQMPTIINSIERQQ